MLMGDITTRAIMCNLDPQCEHPEEREFDGDIRKYVKEKRGELVHACLTILRAYHVANKPKQNISVMGRFEEWSDVVRSAIIWAGEPDPCRSRREIEKNDPDREKLVGLLSAWHDVFGEKEITMKNIKEVLGDWQDNSQKEKLEDAIIPIAGSKNFIDYRKLGYYLKANKNRIEGGYQLQETGKRSKKGYLWKVSWVFLWEKAEKVKDLASEFISEKDIDKKIGTDKLEPEDHKKFWNIMSKVIG